MEIISGKDIFSKSPFTGAYRRSGDGDYHCTRAELNAMLGGKAH